MRIAILALPVVAITAITGCGTSSDTACDDGSCSDQPPGGGDGSNGNGGGGNGGGDTTSPPPPPAMVTPATCDAVAAAVTVPLDDGEYQLFVGGNASKPWMAYCAGMASGAGVEYLSLDPTVNFSQYTVGYGVSGTDVRTSYAKVRIEPFTLELDTTDTSFATSSGGTQVGATQITSMGYASAASCDTAASGVGSVDLDGTSFVVAADGFTLGGAGAVGAATYSPNSKVVTLAGGGYCGDIVPAASTTLQLVYP